MAVYTLNELLVKNLLQQNNLLQQPNLLLYPSQITTPAAPTFSPTAGSYTGAQTVIITGPVGTTAIYFTLDGSTPTTASQLYNLAGVIVSSSETLNAIAIVGGVTSSVGTAAYTIGQTSQTAAFIARITTPSAPRAVAYNKLITGLVNSGVWAKLDGLYVYAAADSATALTNLIQSSFGQTTHGSPSFATDTGYSGDGGTSTYLDTGFDPTTATSPNFTQNSASEFGWRTILGAGDSGRIVGAPGSQTFYLPGNSARVNSATSTTSTLHGNLGLFTAVRPNATTQVLYQGGVLQISAASNSISIPAGDTLVSLNTSKIAASTNGQLSAYGYGAALTSDDNCNLVNYLTNYFNAIASALPIDAQLTASTIVSNPTNIGFGPGIARLLDGRLISTYIIQSGGTSGDIRYKTSSDNGITWSVEGTVATHPTSQAYSDSSVTVLPSGSILVSCIEHNGAVLAVNVFQGTVAGNLSISWSAPIVVTSALTNPATTSYPLQLANGKVMLGVYNAVENIINVVFSSDGGSTWGSEAHVAQTSVTGNVDIWNESNYVQFANGTIFGILRNNNATNVSRQGWWTVTSTDNGATWSSPVQMLTAMINPSRPALSITPSGKLFVMGRDITSGTSDNQTSYSYSLDGGVTWSAVQNYFLVGTHPTSIQYGPHFYAQGFYDSVTQTLTYAIGQDGQVVTFQQFNPLM